MDAAPTLRLDRSRPFSEVRGERNPDDPHYRVHFSQDGLPFDAEERLVPDDKKTAPWPAEIDGRKILYHPLYTDEMRAKVQRKLTRMTRATEVVEEEEKAAVQTEAEVADEVNLAAWARGEVDYEPAVLYAAVKARFGINAGARRTSSKGSMT
jgi:hypothetical protein